MLLTAGLAGADASRAQTDPAASNPCALADAFRDAGEKPQARKAYVAVLQGSPTEACALAGLKALNTKVEKPEISCSKADELLTAGNLPAAKAKYAELAGQGATCATTGLTAVAELERICAQGKALADAHQDSDAVTAYKKALEKNPNLPCAKDGIDDTVIDNTTRVVDDAVDVATVILEVVGLALILFLLFLMLGYVPHVGGWIKRLPVARSILSPRLSLGDFSNEPGDLKVGAAIPARMKVLLQRMREAALSDEAPDTGLDIGGTNEEFANLVSGSSALSNALKEARDVSDHTKVVTAIIDFIIGVLPVDRLSIVGALEPAGTDGVAADLTLENNGSQRAATRLTSALSEKTATASDYMRLADPAAVWVQYVVAADLGKDNELTENAARSYALTREGIDRQTEDDRDAAREAFQEAISLNPRNWAARVSLVILQAQNAKDYHQAVDTTAAALAEMIDGNAT